MTENKKNASYLSLAICAAFAVISLFFFGVFSFQQKDELFQEQNQSVSSELSRHIENIQTLISKLDAIQLKIGTASSAQLIESYNSLSNEFNRTALEMLATPELKENPVLKNTVIAANNQTTEFLDDIKKQLSASKKLALKE